MRYYRFAIFFPEFAEIENIDIEAPDRDAAWTEARKVAIDLYGEEPASRMTLEVEV